MNTALKAQTNNGVSSISLEQFWQIQNPDVRTPRARSAIRDAVHAMKPGTAILISHKSLGCKYDGYGTKRASCSVGPLLHYRKKMTGYCFMFKHVGDGKIAIACVSSKTDMVNVQKPQ